MQTKVKVALTQDDQTAKVSIKVSVKSHYKPGWWLHSSIDADSQRLKYNVHLVAELLAYKFGEYGESHNPREVGYAALEALSDIQRVAERKR